MKKDELDKDQYFLTTVHLFLTVVVMYFLLSASGCFDDDEQIVETDLGPETKISNVADAYYNIMKNKTALNLKVGTKTLYEANQRIDLGPVIKLYEIQREIIGSAMDPQKANTLVVTVRATEKEFDEYGNVVATNGPYDDSFSVDVTGESAAASIESMSLADSKDYDRIYVRAAKKEVTKVTYHRLKVRDLTLPAPKQVAGKPNCGDIENCEYPAREINFDAVEWYKDGSYQKRKISWVITSHMPGYLGGVYDGFGGMVSQCESMIYKVKDKTTGKPKSYLVNTCSQVLRDFE